MKVTKNTGLTIFDIDDTLFKTSAKIIITKNGKFLKRITPAEYNIYTIGPGEDIDLSEFKSSKLFFDSAIPIQNVFKKALSILQRVQSKLGSKVIILTARSDLDNKKIFLDTFRKYKFNIDAVYVERAGNLGISSHEGKKQIIARYLATGQYGHVRLFDDHRQNLISFLELREKFPDIFFNAYRINEKGDIIKFNGD